MATPELLNAIRIDSGGNKFTELTIQGDGKYLEWAMEYASTYSSNFPFMLDMQAMVWNNESLTPRQVAAILNCALKEASFLPDEKPKTIIEGPVVVATNVNTGDTYSIVPPVVESAPPVSLDEIQSQMDKITEVLSNTETTSIIDDLLKDIEESKVYERDLFEQLHQKVDVLRQERTEKANKVKEIEDNLSNLRQELDRLNAEYSRASELAEASERLAKITERLNALKENAPWKESVREYQWDDICFNLASFIEGRNGVLNANPMGLGKTFETVASLWLMSPIFEEQYNRKPNILWLTKKSLIKSSIREIQKWWPEIQPMPVSGNKQQREFIVDLALKNSFPVVVNYDALNTTPALMDTTWDIVVMDEVQRLKGGANYKPTLVWENTNAVAQKAKFIMPLSGSPIENHPKDMWAYLHMMDKVRFPDPTDFCNRFALGYDNGLSVSWDRLIKILSNRIIRRDKNEELDLPEKIRFPLYLEMGDKQRAIYDHLKEHFFVWLDEQKSDTLTTTSILAQLTRLRQVAIYPGSIQLEDGKRLECEESIKLDETMDLLEQLLAENEQVVVWSSQFNEPLYELERRINKTFPDVQVKTMTGANVQQYDKIEQDFQNGEIRILLCNMKSAGEGLNFQCSNHSIFLDQWYNPQKNYQAEDRQWRIGQQNHVMVHILQCENSVDQFIQAIIDKKDAMTEGIMHDDRLKKSGGWQQYLREIL